MTLQDFVDLIYLRAAEQGWEPDELEIEYFDLAQFPEEGDIEVVINDGRLIVTSVE